MLRASIGALDDDNGTARTPRAGGTGGGVVGGVDEIWVHILAKSGCFCYLWFGLL